MVQENSGFTDSMYKRAILLRSRTQYRSIASDLVQFLIRYRYDNNR